MDGNRDSLQNWFKATTGVVTALAVVAVGLRLLARYEKKQKLWWDDWMIIWSLVSDALVLVRLIRTNR
jgi:nicotinamide riboside transporter PnuC